MKKEYESFNCSDVEIINNLVRIGNILDKKSSIFLMIDQKGPPVSCKLDELNSNDIFKTIMETNKSVLYSASLHGTIPSLSNLSITRNESLIKIIFNSSDGIPFELQLKTLVTIQEYFKIFERTASVEKMLGPELTEFYRKREQTLIKLEEHSERIIERNEQYKQQLDSNLKEQLEKLNEIHAKQREELEAEFKKKNDELSCREETLSTKLKELDDHDSRFARRQIRIDLKQAIAGRGKNFCLTSNTIRKRIIIHATFIFLISFISYLLWHVLNYEALGSGISEWFRVARISLLTLGAAASLIYYIRWNDLWFSKHAEEEFRIKRFELDIDRASWVVETVMDWKDEKGIEIPENLIQGLSANLFEPNNSLKSVRHPYEDLMRMLVNSSSEINIPLPGGGSIKLNNKGVDKLKTDLAKED